MARAQLVLTPWQIACRAGHGWALPNASYNPDAADTIMAVRNDNETRDFFIQSVMIGAQDFTEIVIHRITAAYTSAGTAIVAVNMSDLNANASELTAHGDETGNIQGDIITKFGIGQDADQTTNDSREVVFNGGLILKPGHAIGIDAVAATTLAWASVWGYFEIEDAS